MSKNFLIAVIAATSMLLLSGKVVPADVYTGLQYNPQNNSLSGMSYTSLHYGEIENEYWCVQWDLENVCTHIHLYFPGSATIGALYGPSGLNQTHYAQSENGGAGSGVGYSEWYPQAGQWTAIGNHYILVDVYYCSVWYDQQWGGYILGECDYQWSGGSYSLGATSAQATVPSPNICSLSQLDAKAIEEAFSFPTQEPFERAASLKCINSMVVVTQRNDSFGVFDRVPPWGWNGFGYTLDPCASLSWAGQSSNEGTVHSHPWFTTPQQYREGYGCNNATLNQHPWPDQATLNFQNSEGNNFSVYDIATYNGGVGPGYLRTSSGTIVRRYLNGSPTQVYP